MRTAGLCIVASAQALAFLACAQVQPPSPPPSPPTPPPVTAREVCDLAKVEKGLYCDTCKVMLQGDMVLDGRFCRECHMDVPLESRTAARSIRVCVKTYYTEATESGNDG